MLAPTSWLNWLILHGGPAGWAFGRETAIVSSARSKLEWHSTSAYSSPMKTVSITEAKNTSAP